MNKKIFLSVPYLLFYGIKLFIDKGYRLNDRKSMQRIAILTILYFALFSLPVAWLMPSLNWLSAALFKATALQIAFDALCVYAFGVWITYLFLRRIKSIAS